MTGKLKLGIIPKLRKHMERSHSGLVRALGKRVYRKVSRVQIPPSPHLKEPTLWLSFLNIEGMGPRICALHSRKRVQLRAKRGENHPSLSADMKQVICKDITGATFTVSSDKLSFRPSVYGIIIKNNQVLLSKQWSGYNFPGGGIELGETIEEALIREVKEETGFDIKVGKLVTCTHCFFKFPDQDIFVQSILIYYLCEVIGGTASLEYLEDYEKSQIEHPEWLDINNAKKAKFYSTVDCHKILDQALKAK